MRKSLIVAVALGLAACSSTTEPGAPTPLEQLPRALSHAEQDVLTASNGFAFDLLRATLAEDDRPNVLLSPLSATLALSMTMNGAAGSTLDAMRTTLGFPGDVAQANAANESLIELLLGIDSKVDIRIANSIWARAGFPFEQSFFDTTRRWYSAQVQTLDFTAPTAANTINEWVDRATRGRIDGIVEAPLSDDAVMYLLNAIYFKSTWRDRFDPARTQNAPFNTLGGSVRQVRMMTRTGPAYYAYAGNMQLLEQTYSRGAYAMTIVLPPAGTSVDDVIAALDAETWNTWMAALQETELDVAMPSYRVEYDAKLNTPLINLGMQIAFTDDADFSAMSSLGHDMFISEVKQKTYMEVNEQGTEAAAVTSVGIGVTSVGGRPSILVDRPFIVAIRERFSGAILFIGRIGDPGA